MKKEVQTILSILADACLSVVQQQVCFSNKMREISLRVQAVTNHFRVRPDMGQDNNRRCRGRNKD